MTAEQVEELIAEGNYHLSQEQYNAALECFNEALILDKKNSLVLSLRAAGLHLVW
jgi:Flp pilus assembly protein TadD